MNKICTSIEQSKKLLELGIDVNTADMVYQSVEDEYGDGEWEAIPRNNSLNIGYDDDIPCWSLAALLNILPYPSLLKTFSGWRCDSYNKEGNTCMLGESADNQIDACVTMIIKLHEQKLL